MEQMRELSMDEMDKVSGGADGELNWGMRFYEMDGASQSCAKNGYCPKCNPQRQGNAWHHFRHGNYGYDCSECGFHIATV